MLANEFSKRSLSALLLPQDTFRYPFAHFERHRNGYLDSISKRIEARTFRFARFNRKTIYGFEAFRTSKLGDELVLRRMCASIRRAYRLRQADRNAIVAQTQRLLEEAVPKYILRLDIASFYESIDRDALLNILYADAFVSRHCVDLLRHFFKKLEQYLPTGLPRGLSISATLAELYLKNLDVGARRIDGVYYYARYVDDIIVFSTTPATEVENQIRSFLPSGTKLNKAKGMTFTVQCRCRDSCIHAPAPCECAAQCKCKPSAGKNYALTYLGYSLRFPDIPISGKKPIAVSTTISARKIARIRTRIVLSFLDHLRKPDFHLLHERIRFLTENYNLTRATRSGKLKAGIYYNYPLVDDEACFKELDVFLRNQLHAVNSAYGARVRKSLTTWQRASLHRLSFLSGFRARRSRRIPSGALVAIKRCWNHA